MHIEIIGRLTESANHRRNFWNRDGSVSSIGIYSFLFSVIYIIIINLNTIRLVKTYFMFIIQNLCKMDAREEKLHKHNKIAHSLLPVSQVIAIGNQTFIQPL